MAETEAPWRRLAAEAYWTATRYLDTAPPEYRSLVLSHVLFLKAQLRARP